jgi:hypothetical protein
MPRVYDTEGFFKNLSAVHKPSLSDDGGNEVTYRDDGDEVTYPDTYMKF